MESAVVVATAEATAEAVAVDEEVGTVTEEELAVLLVVLSVGTEVAVAKAARMVLVGKAVEKVVAEG